ncbi:MAG: pyridoxamine 5'-phosphate oxidase family protein [Polyangiaceae bacterium]
MAHRLTPRVVADEAALRALIGQPTSAVTSKISTRLNPLTRRFIELSPLVCLATSDSAGTCDVSPRGDPPGFVRVLDDVTLLLPERPGNRIADSLRNILVNPHVGVLFFVPGVVDTFRVHGRATLTDDPELLAPSAVEGKAPKLGILVDVETAYTQCGKAFIRSDLWNPSRYVERTALPSIGQIQELLQGGAVDAATIDDERRARYARREGFY